MVGEARGAPAVGSVAVIDRSIARVGEVVIWESQVTGRLAARDPKDPKARAEVLDEIIDEELVISEGRAAGITIDRSDVEAALDEIKTTNKLDDAGLEAVLKKSGYTRARYMVDLERQLIMLRTQNQLIAPRVTVTDTEVDAEAKARNMTLPLPDTQKETLKRELRRKTLEAQTVTWIAELRKRAWIARRP
jgi:parvulin-like peptidyl-prolyl isomerase